MRVKHSVEKQEEICRILWEVARKSQASTGEDNVYTLLDGTRMPGVLICTYLSEIMGIFGYDVVEIQ